MVLLRDNVYCCKIIYDKVRGGSPLPTHVTRKLMDRVCKREALINRTCTGQAARAQREARMNVQMFTLRMPLLVRVLSF